MFFAYEAQYKEVGGSELSEVEHLYVDGPYTEAIIPSQPDDFTLINGTSNFAGDLKNIDEDFTTFISDLPQKKWTLDYLYRRKISIDHDKVSSDLTNFAMLVDVTVLDFVSKAQADGDDISVYSRT